MLENVVADKIFFVDNIFTSVLFFYLYTRILGRKMNKKQFLAKSIETEHLYINVELFLLRDLHC